MDKFSDIMNEFAKTVDLRLNEPTRIISKEPVTVDSDLIKKIRNYTGDNGAWHFDYDGHEYLVQSTRLESCIGYRLSADSIRVYAVVRNLYVSVAVAYCYHERDGVWMGAAAYGGGE